MQKRGHRRRHSRLSRCCQGSTTCSRCRSSTSRPSSSTSRPTSSHCSRTATPATAAATAGAVSGEGLWWRQPWGTAARVVGGSGWWQAGRAGSPRQGGLRCRPKLCPSRACLCLQRKLSTAGVQVGRGRRQQLHHRQPPSSEQQGCMRKSRSCVALCFVCQIKESLQRYV